MSNQAGPATVRQLERRLRKATRDAPAVVFGAIRLDGTTITRAAGVADVHAQRKAETTTVFPWFSVTKLFTATAVMQLVEAGAIDLGKSVTTYLPDMIVRRNHRDASVRDLLSHTAGLANPIPISWVHLPDEPAPTIEEMVRRHVGTRPKLRTAPGSTSAYSNLGYLLLGRIVEIVSGTSFEEYICRRVLTPLGCTSSGFSPPLDMATGYQNRRSVMGLLARWMVDRKFFGENAGRYQALRPALVDGAPYGGLIGPVEDLLRFGHAVILAWAGCGSPILTPASVRLMLSPTRVSAGRPTHIGLGWQLGPAGSESYAYHLGGGAGFCSELRIYPLQGYAVAVLANETSFKTARLARLIIP